MNFYKFLKQQYDDYKKEECSMLLTTCDGCPCKILRDKTINSCEQIDCTSDMIYLADKYNIRNFKAYLCNDCMIAAVKIAKKMSENINRI